MKITKAKDYKKPLYAIGIAAVMTAAAVTGCGPVEHGGTAQLNTPPTEEVELAGDVAEYQIESENGIGDEDGGERGQKTESPLITGGIVCPECD